MQWKEQPKHVVIGNTSSPIDLDSYLIIPSTSWFSIGKNYINFQYPNGPDNKKWLDTDERGGKGGPETITVHKFPKEKEVYKYVVHNYSKRPDIKTSDANVKVYNADRLIGEYKIPLHGYQYKLV